LGFLEQSTVVLANNIFKKKNVFSFI